MRMRGLCLFIVFALWAAVQCHAQSGQTEIISGTVTFVSSRSVYVQCDTDGRITEGDTIMAGLSRDVLLPVTIRSSSPRKIVLEYTPLLGDPVLGSILYLEIPAQKPEPVEDVSDGVETGASGRSIPFRGRVSTQYYRYRGENGAVEYDQPSVYMDMRVGGSPSLPVTLHLRVRTRLQRELTMPDGRDTREERTDRLYDLSFSYGGHDDRQYFGIGRMRTVGMPGMGGIDGVVYERDMGKGYRLGIFAGIAPELDNFIGDRNNVKRGGFIRWDTRTESSLRYTATVSYIGRNNPDDVTEHLLFVGHNLRAGRTFSLLQEGVFNVNAGGTGRNGETVQNLRSYVRYMPNDFITLAGSYYAYLAQEYRNLDSGLDPVEDIRYVQNHTFRPSVTVLLPGMRRIGGDVLIGSDNDRNVAVLSSALNYSEPDIFRSRVTGSVSVVLTDRDYTRGQHLIVNLSRNIVSGMRFTLSGSAARYDNPHQTLSATQRLRTGIYHSIGRKYHYSVQYTRGWGQTVASNQVFVEAGIRFGSGKR